MGILSCAAAAQAEEPGCFAPGLDPPAKIAACTRGIEGGPAETRALALLARAGAYTESGATAKALADYDAAFRLAPPDAQALLARGKLQNDPGKAEADYTSALGEDAGLAEAYALRGALRLKRGAVADGIADLGEARRFNPNDPAPFKTRGAYFLENGDTAQAVAELQEAARLSPNDPDLQRMLGAAQLHAGAAQEALIPFNAAVAANAKDATALRGRATAHARQGNYKAAIADFSAALAISPKDAAALEGRGMAALHSGAFSDAIADFTALASLRPGDAGPLFFRANARLQNGEAKDAAADYSAFLARHAGDIEGLMGRALARQFSGDYAGSEADFSAVLNRRPDAAQALAGRGYVRVMRARHAEAAADLAAAQRLPDAPAHLAVWRFIAESRGGLKPAPALAATLKTIAADTWPGPVLRYFAGALSGDDVLVAATREPRDAPGRLCEAYYYLGEAAVMQNDPAQAAKLFKAALATGMSRYTEYAAAQAGLEHLSGGP
ncbi:MAG: tetratricopeptide repeat protein [Rhodospirillaceae bacterium]|nr:tetratricopeptide repeat protein [Rhodospirillaceae bacterium]